MNVNNLIKYILIVFSLISSQKLISQTCCSGGIPISGTIGLPVSSKGSFQANLSYDLNYLGRLKSGSELLEESDRKRTTQSILINAAYSITNTLSMELFTSYVRQDRFIEHGQVRNHDYSSGIGDAAIILRYSRNDLRFRRGSLLIGAGPKLPIGKSDKENESGIVLNIDMQPGSGSIDMLSFIQYSIAVSEQKSLRAYFRTTHILRGKNHTYLETQSYKSGDEFTASIGLTDIVSVGSSTWNYSIGTRLRQSAADELDNGRLPNTGGYWVFGAASIGFNISPTLLFHFSSEFPLYSEPDGTQLSTSYRLNIGMFKNFGKEYSSIILK